MMHFIRRRLLWFLIGFVVAFLVYLFVTFDTDEVLEGMTIAVAAGVVVTVVIFVLERRSASKASAAPPSDVQQK